MRRLSLIALVVGLLALAVPASAQEPEFEEHPHMLILGLELDASGEPIGFRKCVDLAANNALVLTAHHQNVHFGTAGEMLFTKAGNVVVPGAPFPAPFEEPVPWSNCEELIAFSSQREARFVVAGASPGRLRTHHGRVKRALVDQLGGEARPGRA
jgi:hypothetical protein